MNNELKRQLKVAKISLLTFRYSPYYALVFPTITGIICLIVFLAFVVPSVQSWFSVQAEVTATQQRIKNIQSNLQYVQLISNQIVDKDLQVATRALPAEKDFRGILTAIAAAAATANVSTADFAFSMGSPLRNKELQQPPSPNTISSDTQQLLPVTLSLEVSGNIYNMNDFLKQIEKRLPIIEIKTVDYSEDRAQINLAFYIKPFPTLEVSESVPIGSFTREDKVLLKQLNDSPSS